MSVGLKGNADGSGAIQVGGSDAITISTGLNVSIPQNIAVSGQMRSGAASTPPTFADSAGTQIGTLCRAWANFDGTAASPITPRANFNVGSVTKTASGDYTINFTNAMADANYAVALSTTGAAVGSTIRTAVIYGADSTGAGSKTTSAIRINTGSTSTGSSLIAMAEINVSIFR